MSQPSGPALHRNGANGPASAELSLETILGSLAGLSAEERGRLASALERLGAAPARPARAGADGVHLALEVAKMGTWDWDLTSGDQVWSPELERLFGFTPGPGRYTADQFYRLVHPEDLPAILAWAEQAAAAGWDDVEDEFRVVRPDGTVVWIVSRTRLYRDSAGQVVRMVGVNMDVTARKRTEERLRLLQELTASFAAAQSLDGVARVFVEKGLAAYGPVEAAIALLREDGRLELIATHGYPAALAAGLEGSVVPPQTPLADALSAEGPIWLDSRAELLARYPQLSPTQERRTFEATAALPLRSGGKLLGAMALHYPAGEVPDAEERSFAALLAERLASAIERTRLLSTLRASEERFRRLVEATSQVVWVKNARGEFALPQPGWERFTGQGFAEYAGRGWIAAIHPEDRERCRRAWQQAVAAQSMCETEYRLRRGDGAYRWVVGTAVPVFAPDGGLREWVGTEIDISERKAAEAALQDSHTLLQAAMDAGNLGAWEWKIPQNRVVWTERIYAFHGLEPGAFGGTVEDFARLVHPDDAAAVQAALEGTLAEGRPYELEFRTITPGGDIRWLFTRASLFLDAAGAAERMVGITQDITARKETEAALRERDERLRLAQRYGGGGVWAWDVQTGQLSVEPEMEQLYGVGPGELATYRAWASRVHPDDLGPLEAECSQALAEGRPFAVEFRMRHAGGEERWILSRGRGEYDPAGRLSRLLGVNIDISERKRAEEAMRVSEQRLQRALAASRAGIWELNPLTRELTYDGEYGLWIGRERGLGRIRAGDLDQFTLEEEQLRGRALLAQALARGPGAEFEIEFRLLLPGRPERWVLSRGQVLADPEGGVRMVGAVVDISERKLAEARLQQLQAITAALVSTTSPRDVVQMVIEHLTQVLGALRGSVFLLDEDGAQILYGEGFGLTRAIPEERRRVALDAPMPAALIRAGQALFSDSRQILAPDYPHLLPAGAQADRGAGALLPLRADGRVIGVLALTFAEPRGFPADERQFLQALADQAAQALERSRLLTSLRHSEERYRSLVEASAQVVWRADSAGRLLERPGRWSTLSGIPLDELPADPLELVHPDDRAHGSRLWRQATEAKSAVGFEQRVRHAAGGYRHWQMRAAPVLELDGQVREWIGTDTDITERKQAEADTRLLAEVGECIRVGEEPDAILRAVVRLVGQYLVATRCFFAEIDAAADSWTVHRDYRSPADLPSLAGAHSISAWPPAVVSALLAGQNVVVDDTARDPRTAAAYAALYRPIGGRAYAAIPLMREGRCIVALAALDAAPRSWTAREVRLLAAVAERVWLAIEKIRLEAAQKAYAARLQRLNAASLAINAAPTREAVLRLITGEARALIGAHQAVTSTVSNQSWAQAINEMSLSAKYAAWHSYRAQPDGSGIYRLVCQTNRPLRLTQAELEAHPAWRGFGPEAGTHPPMRGWLAVPLIGRDERNIGVIQLSDKEEGEFTPEDEALLQQLAQIASIALENMTLYEQEQAARARAEEASRLKDEFLATVSHELRTPLTAFLGYAELLLRRKRDEAYVARTAEKMVQSARAQAQLIDDLLDVSRIVSGKLRIEPQPIELNPVIRAALDTVRPAVDAKGLQLHVAFAPGLRPISGDANRLQQVVWNLLSNAIKFTPPGGAITVRLDPEGDQARLAVSDSGQGISPDFLPFVFDRFRQADSTNHRVHGGLGIGLSIVRHLVELHGGSVQATSPGLGQGATFTVRLPLAGDTPRPGLADAGEVRQLTHCPPELRGLRVLIVDDQPAILEILDEILSLCGALTRTCRGAAEALAAISQWRPQVLVSDIAMPGEDGYWLIEQVRALAPAEGGATPAVALTAYTRMEDRLRVLSAGFQQYVTKPVDPAELRDVVARLARMEVAD